MYEYENSAISTEYWYNEGTVISDGHISYANKDPRSLHVYLVRASTTFNELYYNCITQVIHRFSH